MLDSDMFDPDQWLEIGKIVAPQGLRGEMRVYPNTDFPQRFLEPGKRWLLRQGSTEIEPVNLMSGRFLEGKGLYVIQLEGITNREQVEAIRNGRLWVPEGDRPPLEDGEFHVADLIGLSVYHQTTGQCVGTVKDVLPAGNDLLEVELLLTESPPSALAHTPSDPPLGILEAPSTGIDTSHEQVMAQSSNGAQDSQDSNDGSKSNKKKKRQSRPKDAKKENANKANTVLIPFVYDIVPVVDLDNRRIEILPPKGLL